MREREESEDLKEYYYISLCHLQLLIPLCSCMSALTWICKPLW